MPFNVDIGLILTWSAGGNLNGMVDSGQIINATCDTEPQVAPLQGGWRGAPAFVSSSGGQFQWDGQTANFFDSASGGLVLSLGGFADSNGRLPDGFNTGDGAVYDGNIDPRRPVMIGRVTWGITQQP